MGEDGVCQPAATSVAAAISPAENWMLSNGSVGEAIPPEASSLICVAPRRSCSRTAFDLVGAVDDDVARDQAGMAGSS